eukprot:TRINITY_DN12282_c0_g3_i4.p1 TRINITY_DN12282_c0_g3~~TRINITY_DN12282_c0_g3_i4.p1  ORF type:complete len:772 (+),score=51.60 TRINITY_DN12282_c0_g3_i4:231-2546(+)
MCFIVLAWLLTGNLGWSYTYDPLRRLNYTFPQQTLQLLTVWRGKPVIHTASGLSILSADNVTWTTLRRLDNPLHLSAPRWYNDPTLIISWMTSTSRKSFQILEASPAGSTYNTAVHSPFYPDTQLFCGSNSRGVALCASPADPETIRFQWSQIGRSRDQYVPKDELYLEVNSTQANVEKISVGPSISPYAVVRLKLGIDLLTVVLERGKPAVQDVRREPYVSDSMLFDNYEWVDPFIYIHINESQSCINLRDVTGSTNYDDIPFFTDTSLYRQRVSITTTNDIVLYDESACFQLQLYGDYPAFEAGPVVCLEEYAPIIDVFADMYYAYLHHAQSNTTARVTRIDQTVLEVAASTPSASGTSNSSEASSTSPVSLSASPLSSSLGRSMSSTHSTSQTHFSGLSSTSALPSSTLTFPSSLHTTNNLSRTQNESQTPISSTVAVFNTTVDLTASTYNAQTQTATNVINSTVSPTTPPTSTLAPASVRVPFQPSFIVLIIGVCIALLGGCWYGRRRLKQHSQLITAIYDDNESLVEDGQAAEKYGSLVLKDIEQKLVIVDESHLIEAKKLKGDLWLEVKAMIASGTDKLSLETQLGKLGKHINDLDADDRSLLTYAAICGYVDIILLLMQLCTEDTICFRDCKGYAPIHWTVLTGSEPALRAMVEHESKYANLLLLETTRRQSLLHLAAQENNKTMFDALFSLGSQRLATRILAKDEYQSETPLEIARRLQHTESIVALELQLEVMLLDSKGEKDLKVNARWRKQASRCSFPLIA